MKHSYEHMEQLPTWGTVKSALLALEKNRDITLQTPIEYVVGYLVQALSRDQNSNGEGGDNA